MLQRIGPMEIALIVIVVLLIFGPSKLPQLGRSIGDTIREFRHSMKGVREEDESDAAQAQPTDEEKKG